MAEMASILDPRPQEQSEARAEVAFHVGSAFQALNDLLDLLALPRSVSMDSNKDGGGRTMMNDHGYSAKRQSCHLHIEAATSALSRCGLEETDGQAKPPNIMTGVVGVSVL